MNFDEEIDVDIRRSKLRLFAKEEDYTFTKKIKAVKFSRYTFNEYAGNSSMRETVTEYLTEGHKKVTEYVDDLLNRVEEYKFNKDGFVVEKRTKEYYREETITYSLDLLHYSKKDDYFDVRTDSFETTENKEDNNWTDDDWTDENRFLKHCKSFRFYNRYDKDFKNIAWRGFNYNQPRERFEFDGSNVRKYDTIKKEIGTYSFGKEKNLIRVYLQRFNFDNTPIEILEMDSQKNVVERKRWDSKHNMYLDESFDVRELDVKFPLITNRIEFEKGNERKELIFKEGIGGAIGHSIYKNERIVEHEMFGRFKSFNDYDAFGNKISYKRYGYDDETNEYSLLLDEEKWHFYFYE